MNRQEIQEHALDIASEYGGNLTIRQLYYQFVARGLLGSGQSVYQRVVGAISDARLRGNFPFEWIVDRTRTVHKSDQFENSVEVGAALDQASGWIRSMPEWALNRARWYGQPRYVVVGVEKEALAGVFEEPCNELGVGLFVFRGYSSLSALYQLAKHLDQAAAVESTEEVVILYFGDYDPDGWEIPRSAARKLESISFVAGFKRLPVRWERVALNIGQIADYQPPPFEAKITSSRYQSYVDEQGTTSAWELDALPPDVLQMLIRKKVGAEWQEDISEENRRLVGEVREEMKDKMREDGWLESCISED